jgi:hypothetical protein
LAEGSPIGIRTVQRFNWSGKGVVFPRARFSEVRHRPELERAGVYVLVGQSSETGAERIYIGEGDPVRPRLDSHEANKEFWTQGFVFVDMGCSLNKAHVQFLEARLYELAKSAKRAELDNGNQPARPGLDEVEQADMELFLRDMLVCFPVLGLLAFDSPAAPRGSATVLVARGPRTDATGFESDEGFVVRGGSVVSATESGALPAFVSAQRKQLLDGGLIRVDGDKWVLTQDFAFGSPSTAASAVLGWNANGLVEWKDDQGRTLREIARERAESAADGTSGSLFRPNPGPARSGGPSGSGT